MGRGKKGSAKRLQESGGSKGRDSTEGDETQSRRAGEGTPDAEGIKDEHASGSSASPTGGKRHDGEGDQELNSEDVKPDMNPVKMEEDQARDSSGKRKVDDFLKRQEQTMDHLFKAHVVLPGDNVTETTTRITRNVRLGPGLVQRGERILATRAGMLRYRPPSSYWVEANGRRYCAGVEDQVVGIVEDRMGESYKVSIFGSSPALLGMLEFDGASKLNKPNLKNGALVFCRVGAADKDMEVELTCTSAHHGSKKDWMTGQSTFGELKGGRMQRCSLLLAKSLVKPNCRVLNRLAKHMAFEIAIGMNGAFWVDSGSAAQTIVICNAVLNSEMMTDEQTDVMVDRLASHLEKESAALDEA